MKTKAAVVLLILFIARSAAASQVIENFLDRSHLDVGTAVWNQELGRIHPTLQVANYNGAAAPIDFAVGDGSDGPFDISTYASFSVGGDLSGNIIRLDTGVHPILNVTHFSLAAGWTLQPVGTGQLIIQSLSYVDIQGIVQCTGDDGTAAAGDTHGDGGAGRCGGANGGDGGDGGVGGFGGVQGSFTDPSISGGKGGNFVAATGVGGGGGGSWNSAIAAQDGPNASASGGLHGTSSNDPLFNNPFGAAGGGGGGGTLSGAGGGGGGGGGVVLIRAVGNVNVGTSPSSATGFILVNGGNGGNGAVDGGPGGAGGGGSVQIYSGGTINLYNTNVSGAVEAIRGAGGSNGSAAVGAAGAGGRSWLSSVGTNYVGDYKPHENGITPGVVEYDSLTQFIDTVAVDLGTTTATISDFFLTPASGDFTIQLARSKGNFVSDDTGFTSDPLIVSNHRYIRMEFTITTSNVSNPTMIASATVDINGLPVNRLQSFQFQSAGCGRVDDVGTPKTNILLMLLTPLMLLLLKLKSQDKLARQRR